MTYYFPKKENAFIDSIIGQQTNWVLDKNINKKILFEFFLEFTLL